MSNQTKPNQAPPVHCAFNELRKLESLVPHPRNPNRHNASQIELLAKIIDAQGWRAPIVVSERSGFIVAGHARLAAAQKLGLSEAPVNLQAFATEAEEHAHLVADNRVAELAEIDRNSLADLLEDMDGKIDLELAGFDSISLADLLDEENEITDAEPKTDRGAELAEKWGTSRGQIWQLGDHRVACGDSTVPETLAELMGKTKAVLLHADPPYGMGKEKDGVMNDNLYREQLDAFQMEWWRACRPYLEENASAYIWGTAPDLWRLWYVGGLGDEDKITMRNELVWLKPSAIGVRSGTHHSYPTITERCMFVMLGQQFLGNQNSEDYWEGYEPLRAWLNSQVDLVGWTKKTVDKITESHMAGHWLSKSQFVPINKDNYQKLAKAAGGRAFVEKYEELFDRHFPEAKEGGTEFRRNLSATLRESRTPFDNTHENMTDVWEFGRVSGEERHGHATPKPIEAMIRCIKSSAPKGTSVLEPFLGSGTTLMACENLGRPCFALEIEPGFVAVSIERWHEATGKEPKLIS